MLTVNHYELIRRKVLIEGLSERSVAIELGHSRNTVAKALRHAVPPGYCLSKQRPRPSVEPFRGFVEQILREDESAPRKQRHTAMRIYERLRDEYGYTGHDCTVRRFVRYLRGQMGVSGQETYMPLIFEPGEEAQVDWGEALIIKNGQRVKVQLFEMRLCHSKASIVIPYQRATMEAFLDGHVRSFAHFGGVPRRLAYDNLRSAVIHVGKGKERDLNPRFVELRSWYLFDTRFCNIESGNEKGDVENLVKRSQRTYLTPVPSVTSLEELGGHLQSGCDRDLDRVDRGQTLSRRALFAVEQTRLLSMPVAVFPACIEVPTTISKQSLVRVDGNDYSVPTRLAHRPCVARAFVNHVEIEVDHRIIATHVRCYEKGQFVLEAGHYVELAQQKPGSIDNARAFKSLGLDHGAMKSLRAELEYRRGSAGTREFAAVLGLIQTHAIDRVKSAVDICVARRAYGLAAVQQVLRDESLPSRITERLDLSDREQLQLSGDGKRELSVYDRLIAGADDRIECSDITAGEAVPA
jgi:transposase